MPILYRNEHLACTSYAKDENKIFSFFIYKKGQVVEREFLESSLLIFLIEGEIAINYGNKEKIIINRGNFFLLPKSYEILIQIIEDTQIITCVFNSKIALCSKFALNQLDQYIQPNDKTIYSLPMDNRIIVFTRLLYDCLTEGLGCVHFHNIKRNELFLYLRAGYSKESLAMLFAPVLGKDIDFKDIVLTNYKDVHGVQELAEKANMSLSTFNRHFKETFHENALKWLLARKSESIRKDIIKSDLTFTEISEKYQFSSPSYFVAFCKKHYGKTANEIRKDGF